MTISPATADKFAQVLLTEALGTPAAQTRDLDVEPMRRALTEKAVANVLSGTRWLTMAEVEAMRPENAAKTPELLEDWLAARRVFALKADDARLVPAYALDDSGVPVRAMKQVLQVLAGRAAFPIAAWFESPNAYLDGMRPRELLAANAADVIHAAQMDVDQQTFG